MGEESLTEEDVSIAQTIKELYKKTNVCPKLQFNFSEFMTAYSLSPNISKCEH